MSETSKLLIFSGIVAWVIVDAFWKPKKTPMSGFLVKGRDGRIGISLSPIRKPKRKPKKRR